MRDEQATFFRRDSLKMSEFGQEDTHLIGWQGLLLEVPVLWEPQSLSGTRSQGTLQLDDGEAIRLRCSWRELHRPPDLLAEAESYLANLQKEARKKKVDFSAKRDIRFPLPEERVATCFSWRNEGQVYAMLAYCQQCRRLSSLYVFGSLGHSVERKARPIFVRFRCHGEGGRECWSLFGLRALLPTGWELTKSELRAGQVTLRFVRGSEELSLARVALAESILRQKKFVRWAESFYGKQLRNFRWRGDRSEYRGHITLEMEGTERLRGPLSWLLRKPRKLRVRAWYCEQLDKIYALRYVGGEPEAFEGLVANLACHLSEAEAARTPAAVGQALGGSTQGGTG